MDQAEQDAEGVKRGKRPLRHKDFQLGLGDGWTDSSGSETDVRATSPAAKSPKRLCLSLKKRRKAAPSTSRVNDENRFSFLNEQSVASLGQKAVPKNTATMTKWAVNNFQTWIVTRNKQFVDDESNQVPVDILKTADPTLLSKWLACYTAEARKVDGSRYPAKTLYSLLTGLLRHMRSLNPECPNFLDFSDVRFVSLQNALDNIFRELRAQRVGSESKQSEAFSKEEEDQLWTSGVLGTDTPQSLLRAVFFLNGKNFCLRGGVEHRELKISQIQHIHSPPRYVYTECASKNRTGGLAQLRVKNKVVPIDAVAEAGTRCHVYVLDCYFEKIPKEAIEKDNFYLSPVAKVKDQSKPWFTTVPVGRNALAKMVKEMCADAGITGNKTNHSLRATGATGLYCAGVPEKVIQERTGHLSLSGVRQYELTSEGQQLAVSRILSSRENNMFRAEQLSSTTTKLPVSCAPTITLNNCTNCTVTIQAAVPQEQHSVHVQAAEFGN